MILMNAGLLKAKKRREMGMGCRLKGMTHAEGGGSVARMFCMF